MLSANKIVSTPEKTVSDSVQQQAPVSDKGIVETDTIGASQTAEAQSRLAAAASLPSSMVVRPPNASKDSTNASDQRFSGELEMSFDHALTCIIRLSQTDKTSSAGKKTWFGRAGSKMRRTVAFDGFRHGSHDDKLERDRRYGTVYTVTEEQNAYFVRLEMPRQIPASALRTLWAQQREMPDYRYSIALEKNALTIKGGLPDETLRRLAYVSTSFPADFLTRIEFRLPVEGFVHRMREKMLEIIVFKAGSTVQTR